jgi:pimeloyl-ACP methyl ester carboxylesterase
LHTVHVVAYFFDVKTLAMLLICLLAGSGCMSLPMREPSRPAEPVPASIQARYAYEPITAEPVLQNIYVTRKYTLRNLSLPLPPPGGEPIIVAWYAPTNHTDCPFILVAPIGGYEEFIVPSLARFFAANGYHAAIIKRPRGHLDAGKPLAQIEAYLREGIVRNRQALDWFLRQPGVDRHRAASFGISYGAILNAATAAVEPRLICNVFVMAGGPLPEVIVHSAEPRLKKFRDKLYAQSGLTPAQLLDELRATIHSDPLLLAPYVKTKDTLTFVALFDQSVGTSNAFRLWHAQGEPTVTFMPTGHYSALLYVPLLRYQTMRFFKKKFSATNSP